MLANLPLDSVVKFDVDLGILIFVYTQMYDPMKIPPELKIGRVIKTQNWRHTRQLREETRPSVLRTQPHIKLGPRQDIPSGSRASSTSAGP